MQRITNQTFNNVLGWISVTKVAGIVPLDNILHFTIGMFITILCLKLKLKYWKAFLIVLGLSVFKEYYDSFSLRNTMEEHIKDLIYSMAYIGLLGLYRLFRWKFKN